jgi:hypothetical protein
LRSSVGAEKLLVQHYCQLCLLCDLLNVSLNFCEKSDSQSKWCTKSKVKVNVLNLSGKVKILGCMSLVEVGQNYGKNESSIHCIQDKSMK